MFFNWCGGVMGRTHDMSNPSEPYTRKQENFWKMGVENILQIKSKIFNCGRKLRFLWFWYKKRKNKS